MEIWRIEFERVWGNGQPEEHDSLAIDDRYPQIKYLMIDSIVWQEESTVDLYDHAFERLNTVFAEVGPLNDTMVNAIYTNPLVQVIISRAVEKLATLYWYTRPCRDDLYQESYIITRKMTEGFHRKHEQSEGIADNYLGYLRKYLFYKLKRCYLTRYLGYKRKGNGYIPPKIEVDPSSISSSRSMDDSLIDKDEKHELLDYLSRKNKRYAEVIDYCMFYDLTQQQYAEMTQLPLNTVKSDFRRSKPIVERWTKSREVI